jgi:hypothetical protein
MQNAESVYDRTKPWDSLQERIVTDALSTADTPGVVLALQTPPPQVMRPLFPPRFGYPTDALGILDVLQVDRQFPTPANNSYTGSNSNGEIQSSSRNNLAEF